MNNIYDVDVIISASEQSGKAGSWYPLLYVPDADGTATYNEFSSLTEMSTKYPANTDAYKVVNLLLMQGDEYKPKKFAICTGSETVMTGLADHMNKDWRQLIVVGKSFEKTIADAIETTEKQYFTYVKSVGELTTAKASDYEKTVFVVYTHEDVTNPEAALVGRTAGLEAGSFTYHSKPIKGVTADDFSPTELETILAAGGNAYVLKNGRVATHGGIVGNGEYIDIVDSKDYIIQNVRFDVQEVFLNNPKIPYTDKGISQIENAVYNRLKVAFNNGMIATDDSGKALFSTSFAPRSETTAEDRATRNYPYAKFEFELAGAIHKAKITGLVTA